MTEKWDDGNKKVTLNHLLIVCQAVVEDVISTEVPAVTLCVLASCSFASPSPFPLYCAVNHSGLILPPFADFLLGDGLSVGSSQRTALGGAWRQEERRLQGVALLSDPEAAPPYRQLQQTRMNDPASWAPRMPGLPPQSQPWVWLFAVSCGCWIPQ